MLGEEELLLLPVEGEVFVGGIPHDVTDAELKQLLEEVGPVAQIKMPPGPPGTASNNKGFAFVNFYKGEDAQAAMEKYKKYEWRGNTIGITPSRPRNELFVGNVPKTLSEEEFDSQLKEQTIGVSTIDFAVCCLFLRGV